MKKIFVMAICIVLMFALVGCENGKTANVVIDYGTSSIYTKADMNAAIEVIKKQFNSMDGCELHSLSSCIPVIPHQDITMISAAKPHKY